ncbi:MAG: hypothetical protein M1833_004933 [Piccolia ochrophora]|nr:MAG: hypothetical protein M1833_004933 [Piccolia ochrophora]
MAKRQKPASSAPKPSPPHNASPPAPFTLLPPALEPLVSTLTPGKIYIIHADAHPLEFKRRIFAVPFITNVMLSAVLLYRAYTIVPVYLSIANTTFGGAAASDASQLTWTQLFIVIGKRFAMFAFDYALLALLFPWPRAFFFDGGGDGGGGGSGSGISPFIWRWRLGGFRATEAVVRVSRRAWDEAVDPATLGDAGNAAMRDRILPAVEEAWMRSRTGYMMLGADWDLDFGVMARAQGLVDDGTLAWGDLKKTVVLHARACGWCAWEVWRLDEEGTGGEAGRKKIVAFKDRLTQMGKESLFFRWIELVQYESTQPGGFTPQRQAAAMAQVRELFERQGVNFEDFWRDMGGMEGMPGMAGTQ